MNSRRLPQISSLTLLPAIALVALSGAAHAGPNLVLNGDFEQTSQPGSFEFGSRYPSQQLTDWTTDGYNFVFQPGTADTTGAVGEYGALKLWGPADGSSNGLATTSPAGGNFVAADGAFAVGPISQTISGLTPGVSTAVSFYWAGAQQFGYNGPTTEQWQVQLGSENSVDPDRPERQSWFHRLDQGYPHVHPDQRQRSAVVPLAGYTRRCAALRVAGRRVGLDLGSGAGHLVGSRRGRGGLAGCRVAASQGGRCRECWRSERS